jgi:hypothetical protein
MTSLRLFFKFSRRELKCCERQPNWHCSNSAYLFPSLMAIYPASIYPADVMCTRPCYRTSILESLQGIPAAPKDSRNVETGPAADGKSGWATRNIKSLVPAFNIHGVFLLLCSQYRSNGLTHFQTKRNGNGKTNGVSVRVSTQTDSRGQSTIILLAKKGKINLKLGFPPWSTDSI